MVMDRRLAWAVTSALVLSACHQEKPAKPAASPTPMGVIVESPAATPKTACAPAPTLALSHDFADPRGAFGPGSAPSKQLAANFAAAYKKSCDGGTLAKEPLMPKDVPHPGTLFLTNAPDANDVAIYREADEDDQPGDMTLEYYFVTADGKSHVPSQADLAEAIYCAVEGASEQEQDESGRCLVD
jgi:hypothetical protein